MSSRVMTSPGVTGALDVSHPVAPPPLVVAPAHHGPRARKPVPASSASPPGQAAVFGVAPRPQPVAELGVHRSKKPLFTLTGLPCASTETLSGVPALRAVVVRYAMNSSLYFVHT